MLVAIIGPTAAVELRVSPHTSVARLKAAYKEAGIFDGDPGNIHLVFRGRELDDLRTLRDYGIGEGAVLAEVHGGDDDGAEFVDYETTARLLEAARATSGAGRGGRGGGRGGGGRWTRGDEWRSYPPVLVAPTGLVYEQDIAQVGDEEGGGLAGEEVVGEGTAAAAPPVRITATRTADGTPIAVIGLPVTPKETAATAAAGAAAAGGGAETPRTALGLRPRPSAPGAAGGRAAGRGGRASGAAATAATLASLARVLLQQQQQQQRQRAAVVVEEEAGEEAVEADGDEGALAGLDASALEQLVGLLGAMAGGDIASIAATVTTGSAGAGGGGGNGGIGAGRITYGLGSTRPAAASASGGRAASGGYRTQAGRRVAPFTGHSAFDGRDAAAAVAADILRRRHTDDVDASGLHWHGGQPYYYGDAADAAFDEDGGAGDDEGGEEGGAAAAAEEEEEEAAWFSPEMAAAAARAAFRRMQAEKRAAMQLVPRAPESLAAYGAYGRGGASGSLRIPLPTRSFRQIYVTQVGRFTFKLLHRLEGRWTGDAQVHVPAGAGDAAPGGGPAGGRAPADLRVCTVSLTFDDTAGVWRETQSLTTRDGLVSQQRLVLQPIADGKCAVRLLEAPVTGSGAAGGGRRFNVAGHSHAGVSSRGAAGGGPATASSGSSPAASPSSAGGHMAAPDYDMTLEEHGDRLLTLTAFSRTTGLPVLIETITLQSDMARVRTVQRFSETGVLQAVFVIQEERVIDAVTGAVMEVHTTVPASTTAAPPAPSATGGMRGTGTSSGAVGARSRWATVPNAEGGYGVHRHHHHRGGLHHHHHHHHQAGVHPHARRVPIAPFSGAAVTAVSPSPAAAKPKATAPAATAGAARVATGTPTAAAPAVDATKATVADSGVAASSAGSDAVSSPQLQHHQPAAVDATAEHVAAVSATTAPAAAKSSVGAAEQAPTGGAPGGGSDVSEAAHGTGATGSAV